MISIIGIRTFSTIMLVTFGSWILAPPAPSVTPSTAEATFTVPEESALWSWPLSPIPNVTRPFDLPHPYGAGHRGVDLDAAAGAFILSPDDGVVHFAGWVVDRPVLSIAHSNGLISSFEPVTATVAKGDAVVRGDVVGHLATEQMHSPSGGLHLGARDGDTYIDPLALLGAVPRAVLLPLSALAP